jgi:DNA helicase-2/ATP-dependent DNA helicase PcrA
VRGSSWENEEQDLGFLVDVSRTSQSLSDFLNVAVVSALGKDSAHEGDCLTVSTIHGAKGLEWRVVFVVGPVEYWFPLNLALEQAGTAEEERRLFYVAATRARDLLYLTTYRSSTNQYGRTFEQEVSRFVSELPDGAYLAQDV